MPDHDRLPKEVLNLSRLDPETQKQVMKDWFLAHYTDPVHNSPYDSEEHGYSYIWGGPYDAREELDSEFSGDVPDEVINELAAELSRMAYYWTGNPDEHALDDYELDSVEMGVHEESFHLAIATVELLALTECGEELMQPFLRLLFANVITALETFLFDFFYSAIQKDISLFRKFVQTNEQFTQQNIKLSQVFEEYEGIEKTVKESLMGLSWHNIPRIQHLYKNTCGIEFDKQMVQELSAAVAIRHDIVHRNGRSKKDDVEIKLDRNKLKGLISLVRQFVIRINLDWQKIKVPSNSF